MSLTNTPRPSPTSRLPSNPIRPVVRVRRRRGLFSRRLSILSLLHFNNNSPSKRKGPSAPALLFDRSVSIFKNEESTLEDIIASPPSTAEKPNDDDPVMHYTDWIVHCAKAKKAKEAENVFAEMESKGLTPTVVTYTAMMRAHYLAGNYSQVFAWYRTMRGRDVLPTIITLGTLLATCAVNGDVRMAARTLKDFRELEVFPDIAGMNSVMKACLKSGDLKLTHRVFDQIEKMKLRRSIVSYNTMIDALAQLGELRDKESLLERAWALKQGIANEQLECDSHTYNGLMKLCLRMRDLERTQRLFREMKEDGVQPDVVTYTMLINGYADLGVKISNARRFKLCTDLLLEMERTGVEANAHTFNALLKVCRRIGDHVRASKVFELMKRRGVTPDVVTYGTLIDIRAKLSPESDPETYLKSCFSLLEEMKANEIRPSCEVISTLINACASVSNVNSAKKLMAYAKQEGIKLNEVVYTTFMKVFLRAEDPRNAEKCIEWMEKEGIHPNERTFGQLLQWYIYHEDRRAVRRVLREMQSRQLAPAAATRRLLRKTGLP